ncbi:MAG TPA: hypothetical protein VER33_28880 [Polyangiaceae bacterium]|nr:hypothetical protein [Polyangiaceae bacterium]
MARWVALVVAACVISSCGGSDDDKEQAELQCEDFAETWCSRALSCAVEVGRLPAAQLERQRGNCQRILIAAVPCERAFSVTPSYNDCISGVNAMECQRWDVPEEEVATVTPPAVCQGVILVAD